MTTTPLLGIQQVAPTQALKETTINDGFSRLERAGNDVKSVDVSTNPTLSLDDFQSSLCFLMTGATAAGHSMTVPGSKRLFVAANGGTAAVTVALAGNVSPLAINAGSYVLILNTGTALEALADSAGATGGGGASAFVDLTDAPHDYAGQGGKAVIVKVTEDGLTFGTVSVSFVGLSDAPGPYTGQAGKGIRVNAGASGLEYYTIGTGGGSANFLGLTDVPDSYSGFGGKIVAIKATEDGVEFVDVPTSLVRANRTASIINGDFETGDGTGWTSTGSNWHVQGAYGAISPSGGTKMLVAYGVDTTEQTYAQTFDLTTLATTTELDGSPELVLHVDTQTDAGVADTATLVLQALDGSNNVLDSTTLGPFNNTGGWITRTVRLIAPVGTRKATFILKAEDVDGGGVTYAFDNVGLSIGVNVPQVTDFTQLQDAPSSYAGQGLKIIRVKADASGLEFVAAPNNTLAGLSDGPGTLAGAGNKIVGIKADESGFEFITLPTGGAEAFTDLTDTPNAYTGAGGKLIAVKSDASGIEFVAPRLRISMFAMGVLTSSERAFQFVAADAFTLPANLTGSVAKARVAATGSTVIDVQKNGTSIGSITFAAGAATGTFSVATATTFASGDLLALVGPATADATLADISITFAGQ